jgi:hypothetical protein
VWNHREGAKQNAFDPTEDGSICANTKSETKDYNQGKARATTEHANPEEEISGEIVQSDRYSHGGESSSRVEAHIPVATEFISSSYTTIDVTACG